jgi:hypothetical protein
MSFAEFRHRLRDRFNEYWHSEKRSVKAISRLLAFTLFAAMVSTIAPTLADELATNPQMLQPVAVMTESSTVTIEETATPMASPAPSISFSPAPTYTSTPVPVTSESPLPESSESATTSGPGKPFEVQPQYIVKVPPTGAIDPRAATYFLPHIYASVSDPKVEFTMVCINGTSGMKFDVLQKGVPSNSDTGTELVYGDQTGLVILSAETNRLINLVNSYNGLFISTWAGGLSGRTLVLRFVAVSSPVVDPAFCGAAKSGAVMVLRPLGLDLSTVKGGGTLK